MRQRQNKEEFKIRVREWAQKLDVNVRVISIRTMKNKWASYTMATGLLIFNTELIKMEKDLGDYVIVHELLHFRAPNHGKLWKSLMRAHLGDYEILEKRLKEYGNLWENICQNHSKGQVMCIKGAGISVRLSS